MPGNGPCKQRGCSTESRGKRCHGYCWKHFKQHFPTEGAVYHEQVRASAGACANCGGKVLAQVTDPSTGRRYCRRCMSTRKPTDTLCCALCASTAEVASQQCGNTRCDNPTWVCKHCAQRAICIPCVVCIEREHSRTCLLCSAPLRKKDSNSNSLICRSCENATCQGPDSMSCYFCNANYTQNDCAAACECEDCSASSAALVSRMCIFCHDLIGVWLSPACYRREYAVSRANKMQQCIECKTTWARASSRRARDDRERTLTLEAANHKATLAEAEALLPVAPPAADILRWPRPAPTLPDYREVPDCLPEKHCRLCLQPVESSAWPQGLISHLSEHHGLGLREYRATVLRDAMCGLRPTPPQLLRTRVGAYQTLASGPRVAHGVCASCARTKPTSKLTEVVLGVCEQVQGWLQWPQADWQQHCTAWLENLMTFSTSTRTG